MYHGHAAPAFNPSLAVTLSGIPFLLYVRRYSRRNVPECPCPARNELHRACRLYRVHIVPTCSRVYVGYDTYVRRSSWSRTDVPYRNSAPLRSTLRSMGPRGYDNSAEGSDRAQLPGLCRDWAGLTGHWHWHGLRCTFTLSHCVRYRFLDKLCGLLRSVYTCTLYSCIRSGPGLHGVRSL